MNKALQRLFEIAKKSECRIIGLMSGTSLDGLDLVVCTISYTEIKQEYFKTITYPKSLSNALHRTRSKEMVSLAEISLLNTSLAHFFADQINSALQEWGIKNQDIDGIASHGQTIYHNPDAELSNTFQIVDGDIISQKTGIITVSDFRQKHVAAGGEGAPLAKYLDEFLFTDEHRIRIALNLGGIANLTVIPARVSTQEIISTDVGPANTLINEAMQKYFNLPFDEGGSVAAQGISHSGLVKYLLLDPFFRKSFPKSTGQELFNLDWVDQLKQSHRIELLPEDLIATLMEFTVKSIVRAIDELVKEEAFDLIVSGGGIYNTTLMKGLKRDLKQATFLDIHEFGISADAKEAVLMAFLAYEMINGTTQTVNGSEVSFGKISLPN